MSPEIVGLTGIIMMLILFGIGMPIAFAMALAGVAGYAYLVSPTVGFSLLPRDIFEQFASYPLSVIPMFVLMGSYAFASGIGKKMFATANTLVGHLPGGLAIATIGASAGFGAICGSTAATCATIGKIAIPEMKRFGYKDWVSTGTVAVSGGLGIMIPPSTTFIVYGLLTEQSIGKLFIAGIVPGLILAGLFMATAYYICKRDPSSGGSASQAFTLKQKLISLKGLTDTIILFVITIGGLFAGWFTPTQAGAIGAAGALVIGIINRELTWQKFIESTKEGLRLSTMIMVLIAGATIFGHFITRTGMPLALADWVGAQNVSPTIIILLIFAFWFVLGFFIDAMALIVLLVPIFLPVITKLGYDLIWFGVIVTILSMIAVVTPPVGVNAYVVKGITKDVPLTTIFRGIMPFLIPLIVATLLFIAFPGLTTFLTNIITY